MPSRLLSCLVALSLSVGVAHAAPQPSTTEPTKTEPMKTSDQLNHESVEGAVTSPLRDLNVMRTKIPEVLLKALADPYARPTRGWKCPALVSMIRPLDSVLGPDIDRVPPGDENLLDRGRATALGAAADLASGAIPFRGWVRRLSGADSHDRLVLSAIVAGDVRRGYLKGLGEARGCMPPATPSHERAADAAAPTGQDPRPLLRPKYPARKPAAR